MDTIEAVLAEVRALKEQLEEQRDTVVLVTYQEAARRIGLKSAKTISRMVARGELNAVVVSRKRMIPVEELRRIATPVATTVRRHHPKARASAADEEARFLSMLKRR